jgi:hypothetical protein
MPAHDPRPASNATGAPPGKRPHAGAGKLRGCLGSVFRTLLVGVVFVAVIAVWYVVGTYGYKALVIPKPADGQKANEDAAGPPPDPQPPPPSPLDRTRFVPEEELPSRGQFGDMFGVAGSLFAALSLAGIAVTIYLQQKQLRQQQAEIEAQQRELTVQRLELVHQRVSAQDEKILAVEGRYWEEPFYQIRRAVWQVFEVIGPILSNRYPRSKEFHEKRATETAAQLEEYFVVGTMSSRKRLVELLAMANHDLPHPTDDSFKKSAYMTGPLDQKHYDTADYQLRAVAQMMHLLNHYCTLWLAARRARLKLVRQRVLRHPNPHDPLEGQLRWWGGILAAFIRRMQQAADPKKEENGGRRLQFTQYDHLVKYLTVKGFDSMDSFPAALPESPATNT